MEVMPPCPPKEGLKADLKSIREGQNFTEQEGNAKEIINLRYEP